MQRRESTVIRCVLVDTHCFDEQLDHRIVAIRSRMVQHRPSFVVFCLLVGPQSLNKQLYRRVMAVRNRTV